MLKKNILTQSRRGCNKQAI